VQINFEHTNLLDVSKGTKHAPYNVCYNYKERNQHFFYADITK